MNNAIGWMFLHGYIPTRDALAAIAPELADAAAQDDPARWTPPARAAAAPVPQQAACLAC